MRIARRQLERRPSKVLGLRRRATTGSFRAVSFRAVRVLRGCYSRLPYYPFPFSPFTPFSLRHILILHPDIAFAERPVLKFVNLNLDATTIKHFRHFAKILIDSTQSLEETTDVTPRLARVVPADPLSSPAEPSNAINRFIFIAGDLK